MINLKQVKSLLTVAEVGSVNRAAEQLCLAPSSVSAQLRELSTSLGVPLFDSAGRGLVLSSAGRQLLPKFQHLQSLSEALLAEAQALVNEPAGELRLYAPSSMCIYRMPQLIEALQVRAPAIELHLQQDPLDYRRALLDRQIEAAILVSEEAEPGYHQQRIADEDVLYVTHPSLLINKEISLQQLQTLPLITTEPNCSYRVAAEQHFKREGVLFQPRQNFSNVEVIRRCLLTKMGVGLLPRCVVEEDLSNGRLCVQKVTGAPYRFNSAVVWPLESEPSPRLQQLLAVVQQQKQRNDQTDAD